MKLSIVAYLLITVAGFIPAIAGYFRAKYYFAFEQRSIKQIGATAVALLASLGTIPLQAVILNAYGVSTANEYSRKLILVQYLVAVTLFFWKLFRTSRSLSAGNLIGDATPSER